MRLLYEEIDILMPYAPQVHLPQLGLITHQTHFFIKDVSDRVY